MLAVSVLGRAPVERGWRGMQEQGEGRSKAEPGGNCQAEAPRALGRVDPKHASDKILIPLCLCSAYKGSLLFSKRLYFLKHS